MLSITDGMERLLQEAACCYTELVAEHYTECLMGCLEILNSGTCFS